jgi:hypothetical protein
MKLIAKLAAAAAVVALATPVLACTGEKMKTTEKAQAKPAVAQAEKATKADQARPEVKATTAPN